MPVSILFVDDEEQILRVLGRVLRHEGYEIETVADPLTALARLTERHFDIIVSDFMMPEMSGVELLAKARVRRPTSMRMMLTGHADSRATIQAINEGAVCRYLEKPWSDAELKAALRVAALSISTQRTEKAAAPDLAGAARTFGRAAVRSAR